MKSIYYQFVNFIQSIPAIWFVCIWLLLFAGALILVVRFFKIYNGEQKKFEKISFIVLAVIILAILIYLTYLRK